MGPSSEQGLGGWFGNRGFGGGSGFNFGNQGSELEQKPGGGGVKFFSSSVSESTVRGPDGALETTRTVRSSDGREEVTVTKRLADGSTTTETRVTEGKQGSRVPATLPWIMAGLLCREEG